MGAPMRPVPIKAAVATRWLCVIFYSRIKLSYAPKKQLAQYRGRRQREDPRSGRWLPRPLHQKLFYPFSAASFCCIADGMNRR